MARVLLVLTPDIGELRMPQSGYGVPVDVDPAVIAGWETTIAQYEVVQAEMAAFYNAEEERMGWYR